MESITDSPFRQICRRFGAEVVFTEMVSADALVRRVEDAFKKLRFRRAERPIIGQLVGNDPEVMAEGARILSEEVKVDGVDLNLACPARTVIRKGGGGAWLKEPGEIPKLLNIVRRKTKLPLSVKLRSGFQKPDILDWIGNLAPSLRGESCGRPPFDLLRGRQPCEGSLLCWRGNFRWP